MGQNVVAGTTGIKIEELLERSNKCNEEGKKTLADIFGKLKRGFDGLEYQKTARYGDWD